MCMQYATQIKQGLQWTNLGCLRAFGAVLDFKFDFLAFIQTAIAASFDCREMSEHISAACVRCNETEAFIGVKPLNFALLSHDV